MEAGSGYPSNREFYCFECVGDNGSKRIGSSCAKMANRPDLSKMSKSGRFTLSAERAGEWCGSPREVFGAEKLVILHKKKNGFPAVPPENGGKENFLAGKLRKTKKLFQKSTRF